MTPEQYKAEKEAKQLEREVRRQMRAMATPVLRGEVATLAEGIANNVASLALAVEVLEQLLIEAKVLEPDVLMARMRLAAEAKKEQALAAALTGAGDDSQGDGSKDSRPLIVA